MLALRQFSQQLQRDTWLRIISGNTHTLRAAPQSSRRELEKLLPTLCDNTAPALDLTLIK